MNEVLKIILNFVFFFFYKKILHAPKSTETTKSTKRTQGAKDTKGTKGTKSTKKH